MNLEQLEEKEKEIQRSYLNIDRDQAALRQQAGEIREDHSSIARELEASQRDEKELETFIDTKQKELEEWKEGRSIPDQGTGTDSSGKNPHWNSSRTSSRKSLDRLMSETDSFHKEAEELRENLLE